MRVMVFVPGDRDSEAGKMPTEELIAKMMKFNEELVKAGVLLAAEGLQPSSRGTRFYFTPNAKPRMVDGPFAESKELVAGFWLWQVKSWDEALEWARRCPNPGDTGEAQIELRRVFEADDFGENLTPELRKQEERQRAETAARRDK